MRAQPVLRPERKKGVRHVSCAADVTTHPLLALQRAAGNRAVAGMLARDPLDVLLPQPQLGSFSRGGPEGVTGTSGASRGSPIASSISSSMP